MYSLKMPNSKNIIQVFEHQCLWVHKGVDKLSPDQLNSFQIFYGEKGVPFYKLIHNGIQFNEYVGVIKVGDLTVEVLPKADKNDDKATWHKLLINMLRTVGVFKIHAPSSSTLQLKSNSILDLYFELFINEIEYLIHRGLIKKYRKVERNALALKGAINFSKHIQKNLVHQERFFVRQTVYDTDHRIHQLLYKTIRLIRHINTSPTLTSRLGALELNFPEVSDCVVSESFFTNLQHTRKTEPYKNALDIAHLLLFNYHPDVSTGNTDLLALMFDMNLLWEQYVYVSLKKALPSGHTISPQSSKKFWKPDSGYNSTMLPDIVINKGKTNCVVVDTKWKNINGKNPSPEDLRQLYVYKKFFSATKVALVYPGEISTKNSGKYYIENSKYNEVGENECSVITLAIDHAAKNSLVKIDGLVGFIEGSN